MNHLVRKLSVLAIGGVLATGGFAYLASNSVAGSRAGDGTGTIAGYNVSDISYTYLTDEQGSGTDTINSVSFTLNHEANQVSAVVHAGYDFHYNSCTEAASTYRWTCVSDDQSGLTSHNNSAPVSGANTLSVTAAE